MKNRIRLLAVTLVAAFAPLAAQADQVADVKAKGELVCGVLGTDDPFSFVDPKSREIVGYEVDLCNAIAKKLGVKTSLKQLAVAARVPELQQGRVDILAASLTHNKEREALIDFSLSTFVTGQKVMTKKSSGITQPSQLAGQKVLTVKGSTMEQNIKKAVPAAEIVSFDNSPQAFLALRERSGKDKRFYFRKTVLQPVNKLQQQPAVHVHRSRNVADHNELRAFWSPLFVTEIDQLASRFQ